MTSMRVSSSLSPLGSVSQVASSGVPSLCLASRSRDRMKNTYTSSYHFFTKMKKVTSLP